MLPEATLAERRKSSMLILAGVARDFVFVLFVAPWDRRDIEVKTLTS
jgi:hypothetical protein